MSALPSSLLFIFIILPLPAILIISIIMAVLDNKKNMNNKHNAKYAFYYLLSLAALIFMAVSIGMILFSIIDKHITDILAYSNYYSIDSRLKFAISALLISSPIFYGMAYLINKGLRNGELEKESGIRRWLTYFIILVSSLIILGSFVSLINSFLSGEMTTRFILKAASVLLIAGATFSFYFYDIKRVNPKKPDKVVKIFLFSTLAIVLISFVLAWFFVESPKEARARRLDEMVLNNISSLENAVNSYYNYNKELPETLDILIAEKRLYYFNNENLLDPETKEPIIYNRLSETEFEFCATFRTDNRQSGGNANYMIRNQNREHDRGYQCLPGTLWEAVKAIPVERTLLD
jgi:ABC-type multidrug transport system fused ATPase/permease subunit